MNLRHDPLVRALRALEPDPRRTALAVAAGTAALGSAIGLMATSAWLISRAAEQPPVMYLQVAVVATRTFGISRGVLRYVERLISHDVALRGVVSLRAHVYERLAAADPRVASGLRRGDLLARVGADVDTLADVVVRSVLPMLVSAVTSIGAAILIAALLPGAGLAVAAGLALAGIAAPWLAARAAASSERAAARTRAELSAEILAVLEGTSELMVGRALPARLARIGGLDDELTVQLERSASPAAWAAGLSTAATGLAMLASLVLAMQATSSGRIPSVLLAVLALTPLAAAEAVSSLPAAAIGLTRARAAAGRIMELLDAPLASPPAGSSSGSSSGTAATSSLVRPEPPITLRTHGLSTGWSSDAPATRDLTLSITPGRTVAIVGPSGTGKTTALLTLAGLLPPLAGHVTINDIPLDRIEPMVLRQLVSYTAEDAHVFTTTVRENLRVARPDASDPDLEAALSRAGLGSWYAGLPKGLDTIIGATSEPGAGLSGGERRRLLLARAFTSGAAILLLDEPTEHLDTTTADALVRDILTSGLTVVMVTHRRVGLEDADQVLHFEDGAVVAA